MITITITDEHGRGVVLKGRPMGMIEMNIRMGRCLGGNPEADVKIGFLGEDCRYQQTISIDGLSYETANALKDLSYGQWGEQ